MIGCRIECAIVILLNGCAVKLFSKYLYLYTQTWAALNLEQKNISFAEGCSQWREAPLVRVMRLRDQMFTSKQDICSNSLPLTEVQGTLQKRRQKEGKSRRMGRAVTCQLPDMTGTFMNSQQLWLLVQDQINQNFSINRMDNIQALHFAEELLEMVSCWRWKSFFPEDVFPGMFFMLQQTVPHSCNIWTTLIKLNGLLKEKRHGKPKLR